MTMFLPMLFAFWAGSIVGFGVTRSAIRRGIDVRGNEMLGFSLRPPKSLRKRLAKVSRSVKKSLARTDWGAVKALALQYGPAIASFTPAGPAVAAGVALLKAAEAGDTQAVAKIAATKAAAETGNPEAKQMLAALDTAQAVRAHAQQTQAELDRVAATARVSGWY